MQTSGSDCDEDKIWLEVTNLNKLAFIHRTEANVSKLSEGELETFQFARWRLTMPGASRTLVTLNHPPYSVINPVTNTMFIDEFTNWITNILVDNKNVILMGDFNIHINSEDSPEAMFLADTLQALGLQCHTSFPTHKHDNILDLICTEIFSGI